MDVEEKKKRVRCSVCKMVLQWGEGIWAREETQDHADLKDCVRHLATELDEAKDRLDRHNL